MANVKGLDEVIRNLNQFVDATDTNARKSFQVGGAFLKGKAVQLAPVDEGDLRSSAFYSTDQTRHGARLRVGFTAKYAEWVHEAPMKMKGQKRTSGSKKGNYWDGGENKFLQKAVLRNIRQLKGILVRFLKV